MVDLLELTPRVLVDLALTREDVQRLEKFDGLAGAQVELRTGVWVFRRGALEFGHVLIVRRKVQYAMSSSESLDKRAS